MRGPSDKGQAVNPTEPIASLGKITIIFQLEDIKKDTKEPTLTCTGRWSQKRYQLIQDHRS